MSDIILRIPADQLNHFRDDKMTTDFAFWRFSRRPRKLAVGDHIFFTRPEGVVFAVPVKQILEGEELVDELSAIHIMGETGNYNACWNGSEDTVEIEPPVSDINYSAQGFRYLTDDEQKRLRERL